MELEKFTFLIPLRRALQPSQLGGESKDIEETARNQRFPREYGEQRSSRGGELRNCRWHWQWNS